MKKLILFVLLAFCSISFAQDKIKYKTVFDNVEQNCDSINDLKFCYLKRFQLVVLKKFSDEINSNDKLSKNIDDNIYMEIEVDTTGKIFINKVSTKSKNFEKSLKEFVKLLPSINPFKNENQKKVKLEAILDFQLKRIDFDRYIIPEEKKDLALLKAPRFDGCKSIKDEENSKKCFMLQMNNHIKQNFRYPTKAKNKNITGRSVGTFNITKEGIIKNFIIYDTDILLLKETLRVLKLLPKFIPGKYNNENVAVSYAQPILFKLN
jgi:hypothetical protein